MARLISTSVLALLLGLLLTSPASAAIEVYNFSSDELRQRYQELGGQLRCPKCENQSIIDSNSESAFDLRQELYRLLEEGESDAGIFNFMRERFGDYVLYNPSKDKRTWLLWYLPPSLLVIALLTALILVKRQPKKATASQLSAAERQAKLNQILQLETKQAANSTTATSTTKESQ